MKLSIIINQLKNNVSVINSVSAARSLNSIDDSNVPLPLAFVYPLNVNTESSNTLQVVTQIFQNSFGVLIACDHSDESKDYLEEARQDILNTLVGFEIDKYPIEYLEGSVIDTFPKYLLWQDSFVYQSYNRFSLR